MSRFNLSNGRYLHPVDSRYRRYIQSASKDVGNFQMPKIETDKPVHGTYGYLLFDHRWRAKRNVILLRDQHQCVVCSSKDRLQVHHRQYHFILAVKQFKPPWDYDDHLMVTLCERCHQRGHNRYKVPTINI